MIIKHRVTFIYYCGLDFCWVATYNHRNLWNKRLMCNDRSFVTFTFATYFFDCMKMSQKWFSYGNKSTFFEVKRQPGELFSLITVKEPEYMNWQKCTSPLFVHCRLQVSTSHMLGGPLFKSDFQWCVWICSNWRNRKKIRGEFKCHHYFTNCHDRGSWVVTKISFCSPRELWSQLHSQPNEAHSVGVG